jgi:hypothetical protein
MPTRKTFRRALVAAAAAVALPAAAYVLPTAAVLRRLGERRAAVGAEALEAAGTLDAQGPAAERLAQLTGLPAAGARLSAPARLLVKVPRRCRLELAPPETPEAERPFVALRDARLSGPLADVPAAAALVRATCALLAVPTAGDASEPYAAALAARGVAVAETTLGRFDGRLAYVVGGRAADAKPLAWIDKETYQPMRLVSREGAALVDVRLLGWGSATGGDWLPRAVEVLEGDQPRLRFTTERAAANPKLAEALFGGPPGR